MPLLPLLDSTAPSVLLPSSTPCNLVVSTAVIALSASPPLLCLAFAVPLRAAVTAVMSWSDSALLLPAAGMLLDMLFAAGWGLSLVSEGLEGGNLNPLALAAD